MVRTVSRPDGIPAGDVDSGGRPFFTLSNDELAAVTSRRGPLNRLSVGLQIGFLRMTGRMLNSSQIVPKAVLEHLGAQLGLIPPRLASIRALYHRKRTMFDHQRLAMAALGFQHPTEHTERGLTAHLRRSAEATYNADALISAARVWLYEHGYVLPGDKRVTLIVRAALRDAERALCRRIAAQFGAETVASWVKKLSGRKDGEAETLLEWLRGPPHRPNRRDIADYIERARILRELGADGGDWTDIAEARLYHYAKPMLRRKPAALRRLREPRRTVELACFLRWQLLRATDTALDLADHRIADLWRTARDRVEATLSVKLAGYQQAMATMMALADDPSVSDQAFRQRIRAVAAPFADDPGGNRSAAIRKELSARSATVRPLLKQMLQVPLDVAAEHPLATALPVLQTVYAANDRGLPAGSEIRFRKSGLG